MVGFIIAAIIAAAFIAFVVFHIGKKRGLNGRFFEDKDDNDLPDWAEKPFVDKKKQSKKK